MKNKLLLLIFLTSYWREAQGSSNSAAAVVSEVPVAVGYNGPCDPNPCGPGNICEVQGGAGLCKASMKAFFGNKNVTSSLPDGPPPEEAPETEEVPAIPVTDAPMKAVAAEEYAPAIVPIAGEQNVGITDAPIRPIAAKPETPLVVQLGPIAELPPKYMGSTPLPPVVEDERPKVQSPIVAMPVTSAPIAPMAITTTGATAAPPIAETGPTRAPPIAEIQTNQVTDSPIVPIAMTPDTIVAPPPIAEHPEGTAVPPPSGRDGSNPAGWLYKKGPCDPNPCGPNTKCNVAPNGLARCRCMEDFVPEDNTIVGCKPMCMSNDECPGDFYCKATKCVRACGPGTCGLKADCDGYQHRAVCNCPEGYTGDPDKQCVRAARNSDTVFGGAAIGRFVVLDPISNRLPETDEPIKVVYMDTGEPVPEEVAADALESLAIAKEAVAAEAAAEAEKLVGKESNAMQGTVSLGLLLLSLILIVQI